VKFEHVSFLDEAKQVRFGTKTIILALRNEFSFVGSIAFTTLPPLMCLNTRTRTIMRNGRAKEAQKSARKDKRKQMNADFKSHRVCSI
jgi:hypothetical protein